MNRDWHAIEKFYVLGLSVGTRNDGSEVRWFPTIRQIAHYLKIPRSVVGSRARRGEWVARRKQFQAEVREVTWATITEHELARGHRAKEA